VAADGGPGGYRCRRAGKRERGRRRETRDEPDGHVHGFLRTAADWTPRTVSVVR